MTENEAVKIITYADVKDSVFIDVTVDGSMNDCQVVSDGLSKHFPDLKFYVHNTCVKLDVVTPTKFVDKVIEAERRAWSEVFMPEILKALEKK